MLRQVAELDDEHTSRAAYPATCMSRRRIDRAGDPHANPAQNSILIAPPPTDPTG